MIFDNQLETGAGTDTEAKLVVMDGIHIHDAVREDRKDDIFCDLRYVRKETIVALAAQKSININFVGKCSG